MNESSPPMHGHILSMKKDLGEGDSMEMNHSKEDFCSSCLLVVQLGLRLPFFSFPDDGLSFLGGKRRKKAIFWLNVSTVA